MIPLGVPFTLNRNSPQADGLISWWTSFAGVGIFRDLVGGYNGTLEGGTENPTWQSSAMGNAPYFDGDDDRFLIGSIPSSHPLSLYGTENATVFCRLWWDGTGDSWQRIIDKSTGGEGVDGWALQISPIDATNSLHISVDGSLVATSSNVALVRQWFDAVFTFGDTSPWRFYVNGNLKFSSAAGYSGFSSTTANMRIGTWNHSTGREFKGCIADLRVYNYLVPTEIIYQMSNPPTRWDLYKPVISPRYFYGGTEFPFSDDWTGADEAVWNTAKWTTVAG